MSTLRETAGTPRTLSDLLLGLRRVAAGRADLLRAVGPGRTETLSTSDFLRQVHSLAVALEARGLRAGDRVALLAENRPEWHGVDFACHLLAAPTVPLDPETSAERVGFALRNSGARWIFYGDKRHRDLLSELAGSLTSSPLAVAMDGAAAPAAGGAAAGMPSLTRLQGEGAERLAEVPLERFRERAKAEDLATLVYPGETTDLEGVRISHGEAVARVEACGRALNARGGIGPEDRVLSFLPLAEDFQRTFGYLCFLRGASISYLPDRERLAAALAAEKPTVLTADPAEYGRAHRLLLKNLDQLPLWTRGLLGWALGAGERYAEALTRGPAGPRLALEGRLAHRVARRWAQAGFGGRLRLALIAPPPSASLDGGDPEDAAATARFFAAAGLPLCREPDLNGATPAQSAPAESSSRLA
ncbi:MAG: AMP-binding protein [Acidobacteriota bacterium]